MALIIAVYLFASSRTTLWDRDEPRFSRATYEMVETGNYLFPTFNGELRPDKPIMIYWLMSVPVRIFSFLGPHAFPARFIAAFGTAFTCLFTFFIARRLFNTKTAFAATGILASTLLVFTIGTFATADSILLPAMTAAIMILLRSIDRGRLTPLDTIYLAAAFAFALLAKGPVGYLPALVILITLLLKRKQGIKFWPIFAPTILAMLIAAAIFLLWAIPANNATDGEFYRLGIGKHVVGRSTSAMESHGGNFFLYLPYYFIVTPLIFFPWVLHLPAAISASLGSRLANQTGKHLVLGWALPIIILMTLVATKLPHYIILSFPALAIITAALLTGQNSQLSTWDRKWLRGGIWFFGIVNGAIAIALIALPFYFKSGIISYIAGPIAGTILIIGGTLVNKYQLREDTNTSTRILIKTIITAFAIVLIVVLPAIDSTKIPPKIAKAIVANTDQTVPVGYCSFKEPTLNFYIGRHIEPLNTKQAVQWFNSNKNAILIIPKDKYEVIKSELAPNQEITSASGFNYSNGKHDTIIAIQKNEL